MRFISDVYPLFLLFLLFIVSRPVFAQKLDGMASNPIIWADVPDPSVIRVGNVYYMTSTTMHMNPGVPIMRSEDLVNWEIVNYVYHILDDSDKQTLRNGQDEYGQGSWASSLRYNNGTFYVVFSSGSIGKTFIYQTENIEKGPWTRSTINHLYHDMSLLFDDDGRVYMVHGSGDIWLTELTADATGVKEDGLNQVIIPDSSLIAGSNVGLPAEGAHLHKIDGKYYIFLITWPAGGIRTQLCYRADSITGPYEGRVVLSDRGIAQGGLVETQDGDWYALLFQDHGAVGRIPFLIPVTWDNDWPIFGDNGQAPQTIPITMSRSKSKITASDEFYQGSGRMGAHKPSVMDGERGENDYNGSNLALVWQWNHNPHNDYWSLTDRPGYLRLTNGKTSSSILDARNLLTQRTFGPECSGTIALETANMKDGDYAGLAALQKNYGFVAVKKSGTYKSIVMVDASSGTPVEIESVPLNQDRVYLGVDFDYRNMTDKARFYYSLDGVRWIRIGSTLQMKYTLPHFMGYRFALFNYAEKTTGGFVDFDYFRIDDKLMGTKNSPTILQAQLGNVSNVLSVQNEKLQVPIRMDALPAGEFTRLTASFNIPKNLEVIDVEFNAKNIVGECTYTYTDSRLLVHVSGSAIDFSNKSDDLFAVIHLKVRDFVPINTTLQIRTDYITVDGGNVVYNVHDAVSSVCFTPLSTKV